VRPDLLETGSISGVFKTGFLMQYERMESKKSNWLDVEKDDFISNHMTRLHKRFCVGFAAKVVSNLNFDKLFLKWVDRRRQIVLQLVHEFVHV
jgi:hypothetical protein